MCTLRAPMLIRPLRPLGGVSSQHCPSERTVRHVASAQRPERPERPEDSSWADLASDLATTAKGALTKLGGQLFGRKDDAEIKRRRREEGRVAPPPTEVLGSGLLGGLVGGVVGKMVETAFSMGSRMMEEQREQAAGLFDTATSTVRDSTEARTLLGGSIQCSPPTSQATMSSNVNGREVKSTDITFRASGSIASGVVSASSRETGDKESTLSIRLRMPSGETVQIPVISGAGSEANVYDADWEEVHK